MQNSQLQLAQTVWNQRTTAPFTARFESIRAHAASWFWHRTDTVLQQGPRLGLQGTAAEPLMAQSQCRRLSTVS